MCVQRRLKSICAFAVWYESSLSAWRKFASLAIQNKLSVDSDQTANAKSSLVVRVWSYVFWSWGLKYHKAFKAFRLYSVTSMARTRMARLPRWLELVFESARHVSYSSRKQIFRDTFLIYAENVCCVYSLESPHRGDSNEYTQHTIIIWKLEKTILNYPHLPPDLALWLTLSGSNYPCLEQISMVPKMFEPLKFDCNHYLIDGIITSLGLT